MLKGIQKLDKKSRTKGFIQDCRDSGVYKKNEVYVDYFFWKEGIGSKLVEFAKEKFDAKFVWTLEKNEDAIRFYEAHGFKLNGKRQLEDGTPEFIVMLEQD